MSTTSFVFLCIQACLIQYVLCQPCGYGSAAPVISGYGSLGVSSGLGVNAGLGISGAPAFGSFISSGAGYTARGNGNLVLIGELPVSGATIISGQIPVSGITRYAGNVPATGSVVISGSCGCGCGNGY